MYQEIGCNTEREWHRSYTLIAIKRFFSIISLLPVDLYFVSQANPELEVGICFETVSVIL